MSVTPAQATGAHPAHTHDAGYPWEAGGLRDTDGEEEKGLDGAGAGVCA